MFYALRQRSYGGPAGDFCNWSSDAPGSSAAEKGLRPHPPIVDGSGATAPSLWRACIPTRRLEPRPGCQLLRPHPGDSRQSLARPLGARIDRAPGNPGAFFVPWQQCRAPRREPPTPSPPSLAARRSALGPIGLLCWHACSKKRACHYNRRLSQPQALKQPVSNTNGRNT